MVASRVKVFHTGRGITHAAEKRSVRSHFMTTAADPTSIPFARRTWMTLEPIHAVVYFSPLAEGIYEAAGLVGRQGYFATRVAPLGAASAEVVRATFFNFSPDAVNQAIPSAWENCTPERALVARYEVVRKTFATMASDHLRTDETRRASELAKQAALVACRHVDGRPLFAGHAALPWPNDDEPEMVLWHAQTLLREFRGDGHISLLVAEGLSGIDAHITHIATGQMPVPIMRATRAWSDEDYDDGIVRLMNRGLVIRNADGGLALTPLGVEQRERIESRTDALAEAPYLALGEEGCAELRRTARPLSQALVDAGLSPLRRLPPAEQ